MLLLVCVNSTCLASDGVRPDDEFALRPPAAPTDIDGHSLVWRLTADEDRAWVSAKIEPCRPSPCRCRLLNDCGHHAVRERAGVLAGDANRASTAPTDFPTHTIDLPRMGTYRYPRSRPG
jgi:hypothetical protein